MNDDSIEAEKIAKIFLCNSKKNYHFYYNSTSNSRGVGILLAVDLPFKITYTYKDNGNNLLGLILESENAIFSVCSIYGPNDNNKSLYTLLANQLRDLGDIPVVIGGYWNATYSQSPSNLNLDTLNMVSPPSLIRSGWIADLCSTFHLLDPYRAFHPTKRDYSYFPHGAKKNRSRIDFFLISESLLSMCRSCNISPWLSTALFDHKSVTIDFTEEKVKPKLFINRSIVSNPRTEDVILAAFADTYLAHADPTQDVGDGYVHHLDPVHPLQQQKGIVGDLLRLIREFNDLSEQEILEPHNNLTPLLKASVATEITMKKAQIWDLDRFSDLSLTCTDEFFFEALASNIKGSVISFQTFTKRLANLKQSRIVQRLNVLKESYVINQDEIAALENELNSIVNAEVLIKVKSMKLFSCINSEKPTPIFLSLARESNSSSRLDNILDEQGSPFDSESARTDSIVSYYEKIYKKPEDDIASYRNCIEDFLGPELLNHPVVSNSKLTELEKIFLMLPLR